MGYRSPVSYTPIRLTSWSVQTQNTKGIETRVLTEQRLLYPAYQQLLGVVVTP